MTLGKLKWPYPSFNWWITIFVQAESIPLFESSELILSGGSIWGFKLLGISKNKSTPYLFAIMSLTSYIELNKFTSLLSQTQEIKKAPELYPYYVWILSRKSARRSVSFICTLSL